MNRYLKCLRMLASAVLFFALGCAGFALADQPTVLVAQKDSATAVQGQVREMNKVETQTEKRLQTNKKMTGGGKVVSPGVTGGTAAPLTKADCIKLGCTTYSDSTCPNVGGINERCACQGGGNSCINEVK